MIDTNQASEDELQRELERLYKCVVYDLIDDVDRKELWIKEVGVVVKSLIRTEKLKLLAEVREEAFNGGLSFELDDSQIVIEVETDLESILTKLEAEL